MHLLPGVLSRLNKTTLTLIVLQKHETKHIEDNIVDDNNIVLLLMSSESVSKSQGFVKNLKKTSTLFSCFTQN